MKGQGMAPIQGRPHSSVRHMVQTEVYPVEVQYQETVTEDIQNDCERVCCLIYAKVVRRGRGMIGRAVMGPLWIVCSPTTFAMSSC